MTVSRLGSRAACTSGRRLPSGPVKVIVAWWGLLLGRFSVLRLDVFRNGQSSILIKFSLVGWCCIRCRRWLRASNLIFAFTVGFCDGTALQFIMWVILLIRLTGVARLGC